MTSEDVAFVLRFTFLRDLFPLLTDQFCNTYVLRHHDINKLNTLPSPFRL